MILFNYSSKKVANLGIPLAIDLDKKFSVFCGEASKIGQMMNLKVTTLLLFSLVLTSCGPTAFLPTEKEMKAESPGTFTIPSKVDILLVTDDTGSMHEAYNAIRTQTPEFLAALEVLGWDYHFANAPLTESRMFTQVLASKFDPNWNDLWTPPFPGATENSIARVAPGAFRRPENYSEFISDRDIEDQKYLLKGQEPGLKNISAHLNNPLFKTSGFQRDDSLFVMVILSNGEDTSDVTFCTRHDDVEVPCETIGQGGTLESSFDLYKSEIESVIGSTPKTQVYAAVSTETAVTRTCYNGYARKGSRYMKLAENLNGQSIDICTRPLKSVLDHLTNQLKNVKDSFKTQVVFLEEEPDPSSIQVFKVLEDGSEVEIPASDSNGFSYAGYLNNVPTVVYPSPMNVGSGYAIKFSGDWLIEGKERAKVIYHAKGAKKSAS